MIAKLRYNSRQVYFLSYDQHGYIHVTYPLGNANLKKNNPITAMWEGWLHDRFCMQGVIQKKNWVHWFLGKQKPNIQKAHKSKLGVWGNNTYFVNGNY